MAMKIYSDLSAKGRQKLFEDLVETSHELIWQCDNEGRYTYLNPAWESVVGYRRDEMLGRKFTDFHPPHNALNDTERILLASNGKEFSNLPTSIISKRGDILQFLINSKNIYGAQGQFIGARGTALDITEQVKTASSLQKSNELFRSVLDNSRDMIYRLNLQTGRYEYISPSTEEVLSYPPDEFMEMDLTTASKLIHPEDLSRVRATLERLEHSGMEQEDYRYQSKDGTYRWISNCMSLVRDATGRSLYREGNVRDITKIKETEMTLRESEQRLKYHFENSPLAVIEWDRHFAVTRWSSEAERIFGWKNYEVLGVRIDELQLVYKEDLSIVERTMQRLTSGLEGTVVSSNRNVRKSGTVIDCIWFNSVLNDENGKMVSVMSLVQDVTEQKRVHQALQVSEQRASAILHAATESIWLMTLDGDILGANKIAAARLGMEVSDAIGKNFYDLLPTDLSAARKKKIEEMVASGTSLNFEDERAGIIFNHTFSPVKDADGSITSFAIFSKDITQTKRALQTLKESEERYRALVETSPDAIILDKNGRFIYANSAALKLYGAISFDQLQRYNILDLIYEDDRERIIARMESARRGHPVPLHEARIVSIDGHVTPVEAVGSPVSYNGELTNQVILRDITWRKKKESDILKLNRTLKALSASSQAMMRAKDESAYLQEVCGIIINECSYSMVWIGMAEENSSKMIRPVAYAGTEDGYLSTLNVTWGESERTLGPTGRAVRTGHTCLCRNMEKDPLFLPWRDEARKRGYNSSISLPLKSSSPFGALTIYSEIVDAFSDEEITLLTELTNDLAYGITALRLQADHVRLEMELQQSHDLLEEKVKERTKQLSASQKTLRQYSEKLRVHSQTLIQAQEAERKAIAYELHDEIGQVMTAIQFNLQGISQSHDHVDVPARLDESIELIAQLLKQVRELSVGLRPWMLDQLGIVPAVRWYIDKQAERGNFTVEFNAEQVTGRFPPIVEITVYRIIQEAITNILRHAQATSVVVSLTRTNETFVAKINDNGIGFDSTTIHGMPLHEHGFGMIGMSERISSLGGRMDITSSPGNGTAIFFELPLNE